MNCVNSCIGLVHDASVSTVVQLANRVLSDPEAVCSRLCGKCCYSCWCKQRSLARSVAYCYEIAGCSVFGCLPSFHFGSRSVSCYFSAWSTSPCGDYQQRCCVAGLLALAKTARQPLTRQEGQHARGPRSGCVATPRRVPVIVSHFSATGLTLPRPPRLVDKSHHDTMTDTYRHSVAMRWTFQTALPLQSNLRVLQASQDHLPA